ncbi:hypothetical protein [Niabella drilacis]|uniref:Uncharacterized protein n=1 Tax=Niabella drilacis (strain DSM 25811 / CCM 8410 / CCUG 62505 / LMG 26954 / E90) TaxID=1285928 RepID=A0A1G6Z2L2_NIADE|nr:hypothetical protein [Niabella drilacis]SDD96984.1 hypothetical protein SAMN04487894_11736 [Niabella drilacis]
MKQAIFPALIFSMLLWSCSGGNTEKKETNTVNKVAAAAGAESGSEAGKTGSFSFDGKEVAAEVTTQYFGSDKVKSNFSVLCQHNEGGATNPDFQLLQVTFVNEQDAATNPALKIYDGGSSLPMTEPEPGIVAVALSGVGSGLGSKQFTGNEKSTGSITVKNRTMELKDLVLFNEDGEKKTVNAVLPF